MPEKNDHWTVDKKVPIALVATIMMATIGQLIGYSYWVGAISNRVSVLEDQDKKQELYISTRVKINEDRWEALGRERSDANFRLGKVETSIGFILDGIKRIENKLDK